MAERFVTSQGKIVEDYSGFGNFVLEDYPSFEDDINGIISSVAPDGALFTTPADPDGDWAGEDHPYRVVTLGDDEMYVIYDDVSVVEYVPGTVWASVVVAVLDYMDAVSMRLYNAPARMIEED